MEKNRIKNDASALIMMTPREKRKRERLWRNDIVQEAIESGNPAYVCYISKSAKGDGCVCSVRGRVVSQDKLYMHVKKPSAIKPVRILKSRMFLLTTQEKRRPRTRKV